MPIYREIQSLPDCFISYTQSDDWFARLVHAELTRHGLDVFLAPISIRPGERWSPAVWSNLQASPWVILLASRASSASAHVQQECGAAMMAGKTIIPVVWEISPAELPGWLNTRQALDLRGATVGQIAERLAAIARPIQTDKAVGRLIGLGLIYAFLYGVLKD
jgi:hypothetical protein